MPTIRIRRGVALGLLAVAAIAAMVGLVLSRTGSPVTANPTVIDVSLGYTYSAKFVCGTISGGAGPLADGEYATAVNVHNLQDFEVHIFKKAVLAPSEPSMGEPSHFKELDVPADAAFEIDCPDIRDFFEPSATGFIKGFAVIHSQVELDVWAVYTSTQRKDGNTAGTGIGEDIEVVSYKRLPFAWGCDGGADTDCDGCSDVEEKVTGPNAEDLGGNRDYLYKWDVYDVFTPAIDIAGAGAAKDKGIAGADLGAVLWYSGCSNDGPPCASGADYDDDKNSDGEEDGVNYDRTATSNPAEPWRARAPDGGIAGADLGAMLASSGMNCQAPP